MITPSMNASDRSVVFLKCVTVAPDRTVRFEHNGTKYHLTAKCFEGLEGKRVLIDAGLAVFRSDKKIGNAKPV